MLFFHSFQELFFFGQTVFLLWAPGIKDHLSRAFLDHDRRRRRRRFGPRTAVCFRGVEDEETAAALLLLLFVACYSRLLFVL
jgi:hypothetical protein